MEHKPLYSPQRAPDWRWQAAGRLAAIESFDRTIAEHDTGLLAAVTYLRLLAHCNTAEHRLRLAELFPEIERAVEIHSASKYPLRWELESRVLASQDDKAISLTCGVDPAVIATYERLFFNVRDRLSATSWLMRHAIGELTPANVGAIWRYYAYVGGPLVLESLIDHYRTTGHRDYQYLLQPRRSSKTCSEQHAAIEQAAQADALARQQRLAKQAAWNERKATLKHSTASMWTLGRRCDAVTYAALSNLGCHLHNYSQWRIRREEIQARRQAS